MLPCPLHRLKVVFPSSTKRFCCNKVPCSLTWDWAEMLHRFYHGGKTGHGSAAHSWRSCCDRAADVCERLVAMFYQLQRQHVALSNNYSPTKTSCATTLCKLPPRGDSMPVGFIGKPISNSRIYITDSESELLSVDHPGELGR